jgi:hypothetical protein
MRCQITRNEYKDRYMKMEAYVMEAQINVLNISCDSGMNNSPATPFTI